jgi:hypothetical protein
LDPYYRTIDGFFALVNKDWCAFGHRFEHRTFRHSNHKEHSPTFLQFLDAVYQIMLQYPAAFEYTSHFLVVFGQAAYSGQFTSFRGDFEDERNSMMRRVAPLEDMPLAEMQFSSVFCYMYLLLRSETYAALLVNSFYQQPPAQSNSGLYLRVRTSVAELTLWRAGLGGLNAHTMDVSLGPHTQSLPECISVASAVYSRFAGYLDAHRPLLDPSVRDRLDVIAASSTSLPRSAQPFYQAQTKVLNTGYSGYSTSAAAMQISYRQASNSNAQIITGWLSGVDDEDQFNFTENSRSAAATRVQFWYRAMFASNRALPSWLSHEANTPNGDSSVSSNGKRNVRVRGVRLALYLLAVSELKIAHALRVAVDNIKVRHVHGILDEVVEEALIRCMRFEAAQRVIQNETASAVAVYGSPSVERRSAMDNGDIQQPYSFSGAGASASSSSYSVTGGLKSMAAMMANAALGSDRDKDKERERETFSTSGVGSSGSTEFRESMASPTSPSTGEKEKKKGITKKLFNYVGGMLGSSDKDKDKKAQDITFEDLYG